VLRWEVLSNALARADVVIVATGAPSYLILPEHVPPREATHPLAIVDIGVPRNVHPAVADLPGVRVFDIDDLKGIVDDGLALRRSAVPQVEAIIARAVDGYMRWLQARAVAPTISALYERAEAIRRTFEKRQISNQQALIELETLVHQLQQAEEEFRQSTLLCEAFTADWWLRVQKDLPPPKSTGDRC